MAATEGEWERSLNLVIERLDKIDDLIQDVKAILLDLSRGIDRTNELLDQTNRRIDGVNVRIDGTDERIDGTNERIDKLILALVGVGGALVVTVIGGVIVLGWAILNAG